MLRTLTSSLIALAAALSVAACGGDRSLVVKSVTVSKAQLIMNGDAVCRRDAVRLTARASALAHRRTGSNGLGGIAPLLELYGQALRSEVAAILVLGTPSTDVDLLNKHLDQRSTAANALRSAANAARAGDVGALESALALFAGTLAGRSARRFGFDDCAHSPPLRETAMPLLGGGA